MARRYPAISTAAPLPDLVLATLDDFAPTALDEVAGSTRVFFGSAESRDAAAAALRALGTPCASLDVDDEDWARRSQEGLAPITVGRLTISPHQDAPCDLDRALLVVPASMGFGTGHHATTRLCLEALQTIELTGLTVLDVGTGSGILAMAARLLGASRAVGLDNDPDAIRAARENLDLNPGVDDVEFQVGEAAAGSLAPADVVTANLTGALLVRLTTRLTGMLRPGGRLVVSGLLADERDQVVDAFSGQLELCWERRQDEWVALVFRSRRR